MGGTALPFLFMGLLILVCAAPTSTQAQKLLVLLEDMRLKASHSQFFEPLAAGWTLDFKLASDSSLALSEWDTYLYDALIIFGSEINDFGGEVDVHSILDFIDSGHDVFLATDAGATDTLRELATEFGVEFDEKGTTVIDHMSATVTKHLDETLVAASLETHQAKILGLSAKTSLPILFRGICQSVGADSELVVKFLDAPSSAYSYNPSANVSSLPIGAGKDILLVTAMQARNNARVTVVGSLDLFSNALFKVGDGNDGGAPNVNKEFAVALAEWTLHERGVIKLESLTHRLAGSTDSATQPTSYRIEDEIEVTARIVVNVNGQWEGYKADDVQIEFTMLDPYVRQTMKHDGKGNFKATFKVPDVFGVYKIVFKYDRPGLSRLEREQEIPVRPFKPDEHGRFIVAAYPYYTSALSMMAGFFVFGVLFLYHKD